MSVKKKFGIIGGDMRQIYLAESLKKDEHNICACGFDKLESSKMQNIDMHTLIESSEYIVLPLKTSENSEMLDMPYSNLKIKIDKDFINSFGKKFIFGGNISQIKKISKYPEKILDYASREDYQILNAEITAEGAIKIALENGIKSLFGSKCLVAGFGRIGRILSRYLKALGAEITVTVRDYKTKSEASILGFKTTNINEENFNFDFIFNTIPSTVFCSMRLKKVPKDVTIIDLASLPGGVNFEVANKLGIKVVHALGIPGKYFPKTAGEVIKKVIYRML